MVSMKNYKQEKCKQNRNYLRYLVSDPFAEQPSSTIEETIQGRAFIRNKTEYLTSEMRKYFYAVNISNKAGFISIKISKDHLICAKITYKKTKEIKTRDMSEVVSLINEVLFT